MAERRATMSERMREESGMTPVKKAIRSAVKLREDKIFYYPSELIGWMESLLVDLEKGNTEEVKKSIREGIKKLQT